MDTAAIAPDLLARAHYVCVGEAGTMHAASQDIETAYMKSPRSSVHLDSRGFEGDVQVFEKHGGPDRAVLSYDLAHYAHWSAHYKLRMPAFSAFGENLTTSGLTEDLVNIGDVLKVGEAVIQASQPRSPCFKVAARFEFPRFAVVVAQSNRTGVLFRVLEPGIVKPDTPISLLERHSRMSVAHANQILLNRRDLEGAEHLVEIPGLADVKRDELKLRLSTPSNN